MLGALIVLGLVIGTVLTLRGMQGRWFWQEAKRERPAPAPPRPKPEPVVEPAPAPEPGPAPTPTPARPTPAPAPAKPAPAPSVPTFEAEKYRLDPYYWMHVNDVLIDAPDWRGNKRYDEEGNLTANPIIELVEPVKIGVGQTAEVVAQITAEPLKTDAERRALIDEIRAAGPPFAPGSGRIIAMLYDVNGPAPGQQATSAEWATVGHSGVSVREVLNGQSPYATARIEGHLCYMDLGFCGSERDVLTIRFRVKGLTPTEYETYLRIALRMHMPTDAPHSGTQRIKADVPIIVA